jgi:hypothetical protein
MEPIRQSEKVGDGNQVVVNDCDGLIPVLGEDRPDLSQNHPAVRPWCRTAGVAR